MFQDLMKKDSRLYEANGLLPMLDRNRHIKSAPERWQECRRVSDVVITCEERCFDSVCEGAYTILVCLAMKKNSHMYKICWAVGKNWIDLCMLSMWKSKTITRKHKKLPMPFSLWLRWYVRSRIFYPSCSWNFRCILHTHNQIEQARDIDEDMDEILEKQQQCFAYPLLHTVAYY